MHETSPSGSEYYIVFGYTEDFSGFYRTRGNGTTKNPDEAHKYSKEGAKDCLGDPGHIFAVPTKRLPELLARKAITQKPWEELLRAFKDFPE